MSSLGQSIKTYVQVNVDFADDGRMRPISVLWEDGHIFEIDRVLDVRPAAAARAGGQGDDVYKVVQLIFVVKGHNGWILDTRLQRLIYQVNVGFTDQITFRSDMTLI